MWLCPSQFDDGGPCLPNAVPASVDLVPLPLFDCGFPTEILLGGLGAALGGVGGS